MMSKSNPVHPWRLGRTRALIFTQKSLNRAKTGVPHGTPKIFPRLGRDVSTMRKTQSTKINRKINFILHGLATRRLSVKKKSDTKQPFFPPCRNWPICGVMKPNSEPRGHREGSQIILCVLPLQIKISPNELKPSNWLLSCLWNRQGGWYVG